MSVLIETSLGDIVIDLYVQDCPKTTLNFIKLCKAKYYNYFSFHNVQRDFMAQTGDPSGTGKGGESVFHLLKGESNPRYFKPEIHPKLKHSKKGTVSMAVSSSQKSATGDSVSLAGSQFFITLNDELDYLDGKYSVFGQVTEGFDTLEKINEAYCDDSGKPYRDIRIKHTIILDDPFSDPEGLEIPEKSPEPNSEIMKSLRLAEDEELEPDLPPEQLEKLTREREARAQALTLEMVGDLPFADVKPPENVLFVCKLNPVTRDEDLELIFSRFGPIASCEIIRDAKTGDSLSYAFVEFENQKDCEEAYFKMDNVLIDDRRIHVDFSQSVSKLNKEFLFSKITKSSGPNDSRTQKYAGELKDRHRNLSNYDMVFDHKSTRRSENYSDRGHHSRDKVHHQISHSKQSRPHSRERSHRSDKYDERHDRRSSEKYSGSSHRSTHSKARYNSRSPVRSRR